MRLPSGCACNGVAQNVLVFAAAYKELHTRAEVAHKVAEMLD